MVYYHVTICTQDNLPILSAVTVGLGLAPAEITLTDIGKIIETQLLDLPNRYPGIKIDKYVIMPTHIHAIIMIETETAGANPHPTIDVKKSAGASPRPTLMDVVCAFKSISTRISNQYENVQGRKIWQTSFYDEIIKNDRAYQEIWRYIDENPAKWAETP